MTIITNIEDLRILAQRKLPRPVYQFLDSGSYDQVTKRANTEDFKALKFRQRVLVDVAERSLETTLLGQKSAMPVVISPIGMAVGLAGAGNGEIMAGRAAKTAGIPFGLSMLTLVTMEDIHQATGYPFWQHVMMFKDRGIQKELMDRAAALGAPVLIVTVDWQIQAQIHSNVRNNFGGPPTLAAAMQFLRKPGWIARFILSGRNPSTANFNSGLAANIDVVNFSDTLDHGASWEYIEWIRSNWPGKLLVKGILDVEDAKQAIAAGADGISVSNHGGTQLDGAPSSISTLPKITDAIGDSAEVYLDSGVRSGQDVMKALALGARGCLVGRPYLFGLGAMGQAGAETALSIIRNEIDITMALTGCRSIDNIGRGILQ